MPQDNITKQLIINQLTKEQYNELVNTSQLSNSELYVITDDNHYTEAEIIALLSTKQNTLKVGEGIFITEQGVISIDLSNIYTKEELNSILANKSDVISTGYSLDYNDNILTLRDINGSILSYVTIKTTLKTDNITTSYNENEDLQSIGEITKNGTPKYTWIGTQEEYDIDFENGIIDEYTECLITNTEAEDITPIVQFEAPTKLSDLANDMDFTTNTVVQEIKSELEAKIGEPIDNNNLVHKTGTETINGFKTFTEEIVIQNGDVKGRIAHKNTTSDTPSITDGYIEFGENTLKYGKESEQGLLYHTKNDIFHSGNLVASENIALIEKDGIYTINSKAQRYVIEKSDKSLLPSWYVVYNDGWIEQGGKSIVSATTTKVIFLKSFTNTNYALTGATSGVNSNLNIGHSIATIFVDSFEYVVSEAKGSVYWYACGY